MNDLPGIHEQLKAGISLLEQLHMLSQTQTLVLESEDLDKLRAIVAEKETVVARIVEAERQLTALLASRGPGRHHDEALSAFKAQALQLIERISTVELRNRQHLETLRASVIRNSQVLREDRRVHEAYSEFR